MTMSLSRERPIQAMPVADALRSDSGPRPLSRVVGNCATSPVTPSWVGGLWSDAGPDAGPRRGMMGVDVVCGGPPGHGWGGGGWMRWAPDFGRWAAGGNWPTLPW